MSKVSFKKLSKDYGIGAIIILLLIAAGVSMFANYLTNKGSAGSENNQTMQNHYKATQQANTNAAATASVKPSQPLGQNQVFAAANGAKLVCQVSLHHAVNPITKTLPICCQKTVMTNGHS